MKLDLTSPVDPTDHARGTSGGHRLVVYGDFECPYTAAAMLDIGQLLNSGASFEVVFRHFPLRSIHPHAQAAAEAAEAADRQGRFWEMHNLLFGNQLFGNQHHLEDADLRGYPERLGLDAARFEADLIDPAIATRVERDIESGTRSGVDGTPSLFIDGIRYRGPRDPASLRRALR